MQHEYTKLTAHFLRSSALFQSVALIIKTAWIYNPEQGSAWDPACPLRFLVKDYALKAVNAGLGQRMSDTGPLAAAVALLAAWEMVRVYAPRGTGRADQSLEIR